MTVAAAVDDNTAFLHVRGYALDKQDKAKTPVLTTDEASLADFGIRSIDRPSSDWTTDYYTQHDLTQRLADELAQPRPVFDSLDVLGDPRRQLQDVVRIDDPGGIGGPIFAQIVGINRKFGNEGITDTLTLRTFGTRTVSWILGDEDASTLGESTVLNEPS